MHLEIHVVQSLGPSNCNRGRDGDVKSVDYGGVLRTRVSSQAQKRAAREWYQTHSGLDRSTLADRSRLWHLEMIKHLAWAPAHQRENIARLILAMFNNGSENLFQAALDLKNLLFLSPHEIHRIALLAEHHAEILGDLSDRLEAFKVFIAEQKKQEKAEDQEAIESGTFEVEPGTTKRKKKAKATFSRLPSTSELKPLEKAIVQEIRSNVPGDVALFGRMMAQINETTVYGATQVAHAISVNPLRRTLSDGTWHAGEIDFFAAKDDLKLEEDGGGAGMIGETSFSAPVLYRYANVALKEIVQSMGNFELAKAAIVAFVNGFIRALPEGNETRFAHSVLPQFVLLRVKRTCPYSLVGAFEAPIDRPDKSYVTESGAISISQQAVSKLLAYRSEMDAVYSEEILSEAMAGLSCHEAGVLPLGNALSVVLSSWEDT